MQHHMRVLRPMAHLWAFYDGRIEGYRWLEAANWVDDGALSLGIASYAIVDGADALIYDTHVSKAHARFIRDTLEKAGVTTFTVVLSHWHLDHIAGTEVFADCPVWANVKTAAHMAGKRSAIEAGASSGAPAINPLVLPTEVFEGRVSLQIGGLQVSLLEFNIHSDDATVIWMEKDGVLLAGDTVEDTVTYVGAPADLPIHLAELDRLAALSPRAILPNHGAPERIEAGGYGPDMIKATQSYIRKLLAARQDDALRERPLEAWLADDLAAGNLTWFEPYAEIHRQNLAEVLGAHQVR
jgi:cyclase